MSKNRSHEEGHENAERWMLTYLDMITLLLVLFIMMYCMSTVDTNKFKAVAAQLAIAFSGGTTIVSDAPVSTSSIGDVIDFTPQPEESTSPSTSPSPSAQKSGDISQESIESKLRAMIKSAGLGTLAAVRTEERGVVVSFQDALLFPSGSAEINSDAKKILKKLADIINSVDNYIRVEGSTDNVPIHSSQFDSNWELASQRAINVVKLFLNYDVKASMISGTTYGEYRPVAKNDSEENKQLNRRVDIVFVNRQLNITEPGSKN